MSTPNLPTLSAKERNENPTMARALDVLADFLRGANREGGLVTSRGLAGAVNDAIQDPSGWAILALTGFSAVGAFRTIIITYDDYSGHSSFSYVEIWRATVDDLGQAVKVGTSIAPVYVDSPPNASRSVTYYYWGRIVNKGGTAGPFNAMAGTAANTADDPAYMLELLANEITESHLYSTLNDRIDLIDAADTVSGSVSYRVKVETDARLAGDNSLAQQISAISAGAGGGFDAYETYYFDTTVEGWAGSSCTIAQSGGWVEQTAVSAAPCYIEKTGLSIIGSKYGTVKFRIKRLAGTGWGISVDYQYGGAWYTGLAATEQTVAVGDATVVTVDFSSTAAWTGNTITGLRIKTSATAADRFSFDWIAIGREGPAASVAALYEEQTARAALDTAVTNALTLQSTTFNGQTTAISTQATTIDGLSGQYALKIDNNGFLSGWGLASEAVNGTPFSQFIFQADRFSIINPNVAPATVTITRSSTTATVTHTAHGKATGDYVVIAGANEREYNGTKKITVVNANTYTYQVSGTPATPATGTIKAGKALVPFVVDNGVVYMDTLLVKDGTITNAKIQSVAADKLYAASGTIAEALIGTGHITNLMIGNIIQSTTYVPGSSGWYINKNGTVEFNGGTFRGAVVFTGSSSGYGNLTDRPTSLGDINASESNVLGSVQPGATNTLRYTQATDPIPLHPTFTRASTAYLANGTQIASGKPRIEPGKFGGAIMVEEGTANLFSYPADLSNAAWIKTECTYANQQIIPSATANAIHHINQDKSLTAGTVYTQSIEAKAGGYSVLQIAPSTGFPATYVNFDLINGVVSASGTEITGRITPLGNGWYRCEATVTANATVAGRMVFMPVSTPTATRVPAWTADGVSGIYVRAAQLEAKPYATSFIDGTRAAESLTVPSTGMSPAAGTIEIDIEVTEQTKRVLVPSTSHRLFQISRANDAGAQGICIAHNDSGFVLVTADDSNTQSASEYVSNANMPNGKRRFAVTWDTTSAIWYLDGVQKGIIETPKLPSAFSSLVHLGCHPVSSASTANSLIDSVKFSNRKMSDAEILASATSGLPMERDAYTTALFDFNTGIEWLNGGVLKTYNGVTWEDAATWGAPTGTYVGSTLAQTVEGNAANGANAWGKFSGAGNTLPSGNVEFNFAASGSKGGNAINTDNVGTQSAATVQGATINFNSRNDRNATAVVAPVVANATGTIDHTVNTDGSVDVSFEWTWGGTEADIDGFIVYVHDNGTTTPTSQKVLASTADAAVQVFYLTPQRRAFILYGVAANHWYTFGVQAYRIVDQDVDATGTKKSAIVQPLSTATETTYGAYRPASSVAFAGDIIGTVAGTAVSTVVSNAAQAPTAWERLNAWTKPSTTVIDGAKIETGTAWIYEAYLRDAVVTTLKIGAEAVVIPRGAYTSGSIVLPRNGTETVVQTLTFTVPVNQPVQILAFCRALASSLGGEVFIPGAVTIRLKRNGTELVSDIIMSNTVESGRSSSIPYIDSPGIGTHTYTITAQGSSLSPGDPDASVSQRSLTCLVLQR